MTKRQIKIYASSCVNASATMLISTEAVTRENGQTQYFYGVKYAIGNAAENLSELEVDDFVDFLFDNLWYNKPVEKMVDLERIKYETYAETLFIYLQKTLFHTSISHDDYTYELIGK